MFDALLDTPPARVDDDPVPVADEVRIHRPAGHGPSAREDEADERGFPPVEYWNPD